ncbi:MFS transporter [Microbacterium sp.]|uniref:MFS transporter n=1 Tax=Microbacterium sp. TaxID=51671 RepID=UPI0039E63D7C
MVEGTPTEALPVPDRHPRGRGLVRALGIPSFRTYIGGQLASTIAVWTQRIAQDWMVLELTGNVAAVGALVLFQFGPMLLFGMWGGVVVDRHATRRILFLTQSGALLVSVALAVLALSGHLSTASIFVAVTVVGLLSPLDQPARQIYVSELVEPGDLPNAISLSSTTFQVGTMAGPALGGLLLPLGPQWAFLASAGLSVIALLALLAIPRSSLLPRERAPRAKGQIAEALRYCRRKPAIFWTLLLLLFVSLVGLNWPVLLTGMADRVFGSGSTGYGFYTSMVGAGALLGALLSLRRRSVSLRAVYLATAGFMTFKLLAAFAPEPVSFVTLLALSAAGSILMWTAANTLLQFSSNRSIRGRVMSLYLLIAVGGQAIGGLLLGWIVEHAGPRAGLAVSAGIPLLACLGIGGFLLIRARRR